MGTAHPKTPGAAPQEAWPDNVQTLQNVLLDRCDRSNSAQFLRSSATTGLISAKLLQRASGHAARAVERAKPPDLPPGQAEDSTSGCCTTIRHLHRSENSRGDGSGVFAQAWFGLGTTSQPRDRSALARPSTRVRCS